MINHIVKSYVVGQKKQMVEQIIEFGIYDFVTALENYDTDDKTKFDILKVYLRIVNR